MNNSPKDTPIEVDQVNLINKDLKGIILNIAQTMSVNISNKLVKKQGEGIYQTQSRADNAKERYSILSMKARVAHKNICWIENLTTICVSLFITGGVILFMISGLISHICTTMVQFKRKLFDFM